LEALSFHAHGIRVGIDGWKNKDAFIAAFRRALFRLGLLIDEYDLRPATTAPLGSLTVPRNVALLDIWAFRELAKPEASNKVNTHTVWTRRNLP
jgi:hypothetical protein